jgi:hypothetical protein
MDTVSPQFSELYGRRIRVATYWSNKASDLRAAAGAVWYCMNAERSDEVAESLALGRGFSMSIATPPVYWMLCGMALELALKAVIVSKGGSPPHTHNLVRLAKAAGWKRIGVRDEGVLSLLTESIVWDGRYPAPKDARAMEAHEDMARKSLYRPKKFGTLTLLQPVRPSPLSWEQFQKLWTKAWKGYVPASE